MNNAIDILASFFNAGATVERVTAAFPQFTSEIPGTVMVDTDNLPSEEEQIEFLASIPRHHWVPNGGAGGQGSVTCSKCGGWALHRVPETGCDFTDDEADEIKSLYSDLYKDEHNVRPSLSLPVAEMLAWVNSH